MMRTLKKVENQRQQELHEWKAENLITPKDCHLYGRSKHVQGLMSVFSGLANKQGDVPKQTAIHCRNYLMLMLTMSNACQASNLMNV